MEYKRRKHAVFAPKLKMERGSRDKHEKSRDQGKNSFFSSLKTTANELFETSKELLGVSESRDGSETRDLTFDKALTLGQISSLIKTTLSPRLSSVYTSKYGIQVSFSNVNVWSAPDFQEVLSLPQMVAVLVLYQDITTMISGLLVVKYRDSSGFEPDVNIQLPVCQKFRLLACGRHLFMHIIDEVEPEGDIHYGCFYYVYGNELLKLFTCQKPVFCWNGLFYFFTRRKLNCIQTNLTNDIIYSRAERPLRVKYCLYIGLDSEVLVCTTDKKQYLLILSSNTLTPITPSHHLSYNRFGLKTDQYGCDDESPFFNIDPPGINCLDAEDAEASGEVPVEPKMKQFALSVSLLWLSPRGEVLW